MSQSVTRVPLPRLDTSVVPVTRLDVPHFTDVELAELNDEFERLPASKVVQWAVDNFAPHLALTASMTDAVLIDIATKIDPAVEVVFIDTGYHFSETLAYRDELVEKFGLEIRNLSVRLRGNESPSAGFP